MTIILLSLICMLCYGVFDYLIAKPARNISLVSLILIFACINSVFLFVLLFCFKSSAVINSFIIYPLLTGISGHTGVYLYSKSLTGGKIGISSSITNSYPFIAVVLGYIFLGEYLNYSQWIFFLLILVGIIFSSFHISEISKFKIKKDKISLFFSLGAMLSYAFFVYFFDRSVEYYDPIYAAFISEFFICSILIGYFFFFHKKYLKSLKNIERGIYIRIAMISMLGMIGFICLGSAFELGNLALVSAIAACSPAVTTLLARIFGNEKLEVIQYIAISVLVFGIAGLSYVSV